MGQSPQSGLNQTSFFKTFKSQFRPIEVSGERVDGQVYVCDTNQEMIIEIANRILDQESDEQFHNQQNMIQSIQSLYIINYYGSAQKQSQEMCSSYSLILSYYEFVQHNLFKEIYSRKENQEQFSEREIWYLLWSLTIALWELKQKGYNHKDLRPQTVALKNGIIKLCPIGVLQDQKNSVVRFVVDNQQTYLPPLLRKQLTNNSQPQMNWNRIDSFAVGHIVLDLMLVDMPVIIDNQQCANLLKICYNRYSNQLIRVTEKLINDQLQIEDVYYLLKPYSSKIMALQEFRINYEDVKQQAIPLNNISKLNLKSLIESLSSQEQRQVILNHENMQSEYLQDTRLIQKNQHELSEQQIQEQISIEQQQRQQQILHQMQVQQQQQSLQFNQNKQQFNQANEIQLQHQVIQQNEQKYIEQQNFQQQQLIQEQQFLKQQQLQFNQQQQVNNQVNNQQNIQLQHIAIQQQQINESNFRTKQQIELEQHQQIYQQQLAQEQQFLLLQQQQQRQLQIQQQQEWLLKQQQIQQQQVINQQVQPQQPLQQQVILRMSQQNQNLVQSPQIRQSVSPPPQQIVNQQQPQQLLQRLLVQSQQLPPQTQQQVVQYLQPQIQPSVQQSPINQIKIQQQQFQPQQQTPPINIITNIPPQQIIQQPTIGVQRPPQPPIFPVITQTRPPFNYVNQVSPPGVRIPVQIAQTVSPIKGDLEREITVLEYKPPQNQLLKASNQILPPYDSNQKKPQVSANNFDRIRNVIQDSDELLQHK